MKLVVVTGGRTYAYPQIVSMVLNSLFVEFGSFILFHGACTPRGSKEMTGADRYANEWGFTQPSVEVVPFPADWTRYGDDAGPIRNELMVKTALQRVGARHIQGLAFPEPGSRGTYNCRRIMLENDIVVDTWNYARVRRWMQETHHM